ncbi:MAG: hypothetical protein MJ182_07280 [Treponema sp.]|nr:hypothetical protein [Treponema sp.]
MKKKFFKQICFFTFFILTIPVYAQSYKIEKVSYDITGITKEASLKTNIPISTNKVFETKNDFDIYIKKIKQDLINTRCFESSDVTFEFSSPDENNIISVDLLISVKDSLHFLGLPYLKYSSSDGMSLKVKAKDTNFLGTMNVLNSSIDFQVKPDEDGTPFKIFEPAINVSIDYPYNVDPFRITWINDYSLSYTWGNLSPEWDAETGVLLEYPFKSTTLTWKFSQGFIKDYTYLTDNDETYFKEFFSFSTPFAICDVPNLNQLKIYPLISLTYNWDPVNYNGYSGIYNPALQGPSLEISSSLTLGRVNWIGNFREGVYGKVTPLIGYNFGSIFDEKVKPYTIGLQTNITAFKAFKYFGINSQLNAFGYIYSEKTGGSQIIDSYLRGIIDNRRSPYTDDYQAKTSGAIVLNLDLPIHIFTTDWESFPVTKNLSFMRHFNFELQVSPFVDLALITTNKEVHGMNRSLNLKDGFYTAGMEVLVFPSKWSSYVVRASIGVDIGRKLLGNHINSSWRNTGCSTTEISIGLGTHF